MNQRNQIDNNIDSNIHLPESWAGWHLTGVLGKGAYGTVYRAEDESGHVAAIKIIRLPEGAEVPETDLLPLLKDISGVVRVEDYCIQEAQGRSEGVLRMEYLTDLVSWKRNHDLSEEEAIDWMIQLCHTLAVCEKEGIIHRDIKPGNILIDEEGQAKLGDFGVARVADPADSRMSLAGTFRYMAPEVYHGEAYDHRADIYSLGMVFYELMNGGKIPFEDQGREQALQQRMSGRHFLPPAEASKEFTDILLKACAYEPAQRYQNGAELKRDLASLKRGELNNRKDCKQNNRKKHFITAAVMTAVIGLAILAGLWMSRPIVPREPCGYGVSWILKRNGTLEVSGNGMMEPSQSEHYAKQHIKMLAHLDRIKKLVVKGNVRYIDFNGLNLPNLEEAVFSEGLDRIRRGSFSEKKNLRTVIFQGRDVNLGEYVFSDCSSLTKVVLPSELTRIPEGCFCWCTSLKELTIPPTVRAIGSSAFCGTPWYNSRYDSMDSLIVGDQVLVFWKGKEEELFLGKEAGISHIGGSAFSLSSVKRIRMDDSIVSIEESAFCDSALENVTLPEHLSNIPEHAFSGCENLKSIVLPDSVKRINDQAFWGCLALKEVTIPSGLESIGWQVFDETPYKKMHTDKEGFTVVDDFLVDYIGNEKDLVIPDNLGISRISDCFLKQNQRIRSLTFPKGLKTIGEKVCFMCPQLDSISFPESLKEVGAGSFRETLWWIKREEEPYIIINDILLYCNSKARNIVIPEDLHLTRIAGEAFHGSNLEEISIPPGILEIDENAFNDCEQLRKVNLPGSWTEEEIRKCFYGTLWYYLRQ